MKTVISLLSLSALLVSMTSAHAMSHTGGMTIDNAKKETTASSADMAEGEIRKVDLNTQKITIKHGPIKNLDMPGMTMVFQVKDPALLAKVKAGDKIRFQAEKLDGAIVVTAIEAAE